MELTNKNEKMSLPTGWKSKEIPGGILFWNNKTHNQRWESFDHEDEKGGLSLGNLTGLWSSRPSIIRENADESFVGRDEYVDRAGKVWSLNVFMRGNKWYSVSDDNEEVPTYKLLMEKN